MAPSPYSDAFRAAKHVQTGI